MKFETRLAALEARQEEAVRKRDQLLVLIVDEWPKGVYTVHGSGEVLHGEAELNAFADAHFTKTLIVDDVQVAIAEREANDNGQGGGVAGSEEV